MCMSCMFCSACLPHALHFLLFSNRPPSPPQIAPQIARPHSPSSPIYFPTSNIRMRREGSRAPPQAWVFGTSQQSQMTSTLLLGKHTLATLLCRSTSAQVKVCLCYHLLPKMLLLAHPRKAVSSSEMGIWQHSKGRIRWISKPFPRIWTCTKPHMPRPPALGTSCRSELQSRIGAKYCKRTEFYERMCEI